MTAIQGASEISVTGNLKDWDRIDRLGEITVPTLITAGRYDIVPLPCAETLRDGIADARLEVFENSSHVAHLEEPDAYFTCVRAFLDDVDAAGDPITL